jgi:hypothetical protein
MLARLNAKPIPGQPVWRICRTRAGASLLRTLVLVGALLDYAGMPTHAEAAEPPRAGPMPDREVLIGTFLNRVDAFNLRESRFDVDFYIWFVWSDGELDPSESWEIVNGSVKEKFLSDAHPIEGGQYAAYRVQASIIKEFDLYKYPLDRHTLTIEIEDGAPVQRIRYVADTANSGLSEQFFAPGFTADKPFFQVRDHTYRTNYGDPDLGSGSESVYSRYIAGFEVERPSAAAAWKLYIGVFVAALIGFLGMLARADQTDVRFGLGSAALFAAIATQFVIASNMPDTSILIVPDIICIVTIAYVFLTLMQSSISLKLIGRGHEAAARVFDLSFLVILLASYFAICAWLILA